MSISLAGDIKTVSELKENTDEIFEQIHKTGRPVIITINGKPDVVLCDAETFENKLKGFNLAVLLSEAEEQVKNKQLRPAREFLSEFKQNAKISR